MATTIESTQSKPNNLQSVSPNNTLASAFRDAVNQPASLSPPGNYRLGKVDLPVFGMTEDIRSEKSVNKKIAKVERLTSHVDLIALGVPKEQEKDFCTLFATLAVNSKGEKDIKTGRQMTIKNSYLMLPSSLKILQKMFPEGTTARQKCVFIGHQSLQWQSRLQITDYAVKYKKGSLDQQMAMRQELEAIFSAHESKS